MFTRVVELTSKPGKSKELSFGTRQKCPSNDCLE